MTIACGAIILAAGQSRRMGFNKLLADYQGKPLVAHVVDAVEAADLPAIVVLGHSAQEIRAALTPSRAHFVLAEDYREGMGRSIAAGINAAPRDWQAAIICLGDMPLVSPALLRELAGKASSSAILVPVFEGRRGNPVLWGRDHFHELETLQGDEGARKKISRLDSSLASIYWHDDSILRDFDTPETL